MWWARALVRGGRGAWGFVTPELIKERLPGAAADTKVLLCGPPPMVNAMGKSLVGLGFDKPGVMSKAEDRVFLF
ncbi:putative cytochrome B5 reductase [Bombardia bombarda]|uniref:Cytochrome B5 reductase n=1 Tax=Bombardia bombarda TaxID=252184 RepID=A0AA39TMA2_9PEZI|nr:putative cytochrome B5 reductase [Bombardia bombarda]